MGVTPSDATLVAPQPKGIIDPSTGKPIGSNECIFRRNQQ
jgi:NADH-quinone oxidoreductase subunit B